MTDIDALRSVKVDRYAIAFGYADDEMLIKDGQIPTDVTCKLYFEQLLKLEALAEADGYNSIENMIERIVSDWLRDDHRKLKYDWVTQKCTVKETAND